MGFETTQPYTCPKLAGLLLTDRIFEVSSLDHFHTLG